MPWSAPRSCWSLQMQRKSSWAAKEQPLPVPCCLSQRQELDVVYKTQLLWCLGRLGCWLRSASSLSRFQIPAELAGSRVASSLLLKQKADFLLISMEEPFTSGKQHLLLHPITPFPSLGEVRPLCRGITGISMVTDPDVRGVGSSTRDSDFIVPLKLHRAGTWSGDLLNPPQAPDPDEAVPMSQDQQPLPCPRCSLCPARSPGSFQTSRGFLVCSLAHIPVPLPILLMICHVGGN